MRKSRSNTRKGRCNFLIDASVYSRFSGLCDSLGLVRSKNVENYMRRFGADGVVPRAGPAASGSRKEKGRYNFIIDEKVYRAFSKICEDNGLIRSKMVEHYMEEFIVKNR